MTGSAPERFPQSNDAVSTYHTHTLCMWESSRMPRTAWREVLCKPSAVSYRQQELSSVAYNGADEHTHLLKRQLSLVKIIGLLKNVFPVSYHVYTCVPLDSCPEQCVQGYKLNGTWLMWGCLWATGWWLCVLCVLWLECNDGPLLVLCAWFFVRLLWNWQDLGVWGHVTQPPQSCRKTFIYLFIYSQLFKSVLQPSMDLTLNF